jgi:hypothetical protein
MTPEQKPAPVPIGKIMEKFGMLHFENDMLRERINQLEKENLNFKAIIEKNKDNTP